MPEFEIRVGHTLEILRATPAETYHTVATSPPYFGLRSYEGVEPSVWGGIQGCAHVWQWEVVTGEMRRGLGLAESSASTRGGGKKIARTPDVRAERGSCAKCGAWQGVLGNEPTVEMYVGHMVEVCREIWRVLRSDGTFWLNLGDSYANDGKWGGRSGGKHQIGLHGKTGIGRERRETGFKPKDLMLVPHRVAIALQAAGWWVRMDNVWAKKNCLPESVEDRPTKSHEYVFLLTKSESYFYDAEAVREKQTGTAHSRGKGITPKSASEHDPFIRAKESFHRSTAEWHEAPDGNRNLRSVWSMASEPYREAHFATFPSKLPAICIKAGTSEAGVCPACSAPWERMVERFKPGNGGKTDGLYPPKSAGGRSRRHQQALREVGLEHLPEPRTLGWVMTCKCPYATPVPALVCDPFSGAGTTGLAALRLGRSYVGHEAGAQYAEMSRARIRNESPMFFQEVKRDEKQTSAELSCQVGR